MPGSQPADQLRRAWYFLAGSVVMLGTLHTGSAAYIFSQISAALFWFVGAGLALILAGLMNLLAARAWAQRHFETATVLACNLALAIYFAALLMVLPEPQVWVGLTLFCGLSAISAAHVARRIPAGGTAGVERKDG